MELYLKVNLPEGKRIRLRDKWTDKIDYKVAPVLYPNKPTKVLDEHALMLLEQDPHLVSREPFGVVATETQEEIADGEDQGENNPVDEKKEILVELAEKDFSKMTVADIIEYGKKLGIEIPFNIKRILKEEMLEKRCAELAG